MGFAGTDPMRRPLRAIFFLPNLLLFHEKMNSVNQNATGRGVAPVRPFGASGPDDRAEGGRFRGSCGGAVRGKAPLCSEKKSPRSRWGAYGGGAFQAAATAKFRSLPFP